MIFIYRLCNINKKYGFTLFSNCVVATILTLITPNVVAQTVESNVSGHCLDTTFPANPLEMVPGTLTDYCKIIGQVIGEPGNNYGANAQAAGKTSYGYTPGSGQQGVGTAEVEVRTQVFPGSAQSGNAGADAQAILEYYMGIVVGKPPPIPQGSYIPIKLEGQYGGYGFGLNSWGVNIRLTDWDTLNWLLDKYLPETNTGWPPYDPNNPQMPIANYTLETLIPDSAVYQIHIEAWCQATASIKLANVAGCGAYVDPIISFDQEAFDELMGENTFNLEEYYHLEFSPVPVPPAIWLIGSGLIGLIGIARRKRA